MSALKLDLKFVKSVSAVAGFEYDTALDPVSLALTFDDLYIVKVVKYVTFWRFGDETGDRAECLISVLLKRMYLS